MGKLIITCMDGASASSRRTHTRMYMSDVVESVANQFLRFKKNDLMICRANDYIMRSVRGGAIFSRKSIIRRFILKHNVVGNNLLCIGKSYGGWNINNLLKDLVPILNYGKVHLILVDACWLGKMFKPSLTITPPESSLIKNYFQTNMRKLNGARITKSRSYLYDETDLSDSEVRNESVDHWNIIEHPTVQRGILVSLKGL